MKLSTQTTGDNVITDEKKKEFQEAAKPLIKWLCENGHPHMTIIVEPTGAELVEGVCSFPTEEFLLD